MGKGCCQTLHHSVTDSSGWHMRQMSGQESYSRSILKDFETGAAAEELGAFQFGAGLEVAIHSKLGIRVSYRSLAGHDLDAIDFGTIPTDASFNTL